MHLLSDSWGDALVEGHLMVSPPLPMILPTMPGGQSMERLWSPACGSSDTVISTCLLQAFTASELVAVIVTCRTNGVRQVPFPSDKDLI